MTNWKTTIKLGDIHQKYQDGDISVEEMAKLLASRVQRSLYASELCEQVEALQALDDVDEYDDVLDELYDFGDENHRIWFDPSRS